jgi:CRISPR-associated protein Csm4
MILTEGKKITSLTALKFLDDSEIFKIANTNMSEETRKLMKRMGARNFMAFYPQSHNTINRLTGATGEGPFAPYSVEQGVFLPETELALFVGIDEKFIAIDQVRAGLERMGETGFGKDSSLGLGRFSLGEDAEIDLMKIGNDTPNVCYTLAPCVPEIDTYSEMFFTPFVRFGRHGDALAKSGNPFKNPVIMADDGAIFKPKTQKVFDKPYIGRAITNISKAEPKTVTQGYSIYIPMRVEV